ncbi:MAG TPA: alpha/beta fold hydrolase [Gemmatimonadaceae bacterium]|nr:alpha/beta fold hydrolase [Gemmatimonadaceae bacterium]
MRWRKAAITGGTSLAAAATLNALAARGVAPLENEIGGNEGWFTWRRHRIAFTRRGSGRPLLLVHGIHAGAWSYEWRHVADALAASHTVYTIDLLGFGRSDRPALKYSAGLYQALVTDFAARVIGEPTVLVASSLSGAHAVLLAARDAERWPALVLSVPTGISQLRARPSFMGEALRLLVESPVLGTTMYNALVTRAAIRQFLEPLYARRTLVTSELVAAYYASSHQPGAKHALAAFIAGQLDADVRQALRRLQQPTLVVWGMQARQTPVEQAHSFRVLKPDVHLELLERCGDLPHDEQAERFAGLTVDFLAERQSPRVLPFRGKRAG